MRSREPRTALVVGGDGKIARALVPALVRDGYEVVSTTRRRVASDEPSRFALDLAQVARGGSLRVPECDVAILCAAASSYATCRNDEATARAVNAEAPAAIARALHGRGSQLVFLSTNAVFDGEQPFRRAEDEPDGATAYGRSKAAAEASLREIEPTAAVLRLTRVLCRGEPLLVDWAERLRAGAEVSAFADMVAAPIHVDHAVTALLAIARRRAAGVLQLSAEREVSYVEIARHIAMRVGASPDLVQPVPAATRGIPRDETPRHASLACSEFLADFGLAPIEPFDVVDAVLEISP